LLLAVLFPILHCNLPLHPLARLVGPAGNLLECLVQGEIVADRILPTALGVSIESVFIHDPVVDAVQRELLLLAREDSLRYAKQSPLYNRGMMMESTEEIDYSQDSSKDLKPPYSYATLIAQAIFSSEEEKLTLNSIYNPSSCLGYKAGIV
jgi:hypothetical protein